jgi:hypothetical protein
VRRKTVGRSHIIIKKKSALIREIHGRRKGMFPAYFADVRRKTVGRSHIIIKKKFAVISEIRGRKKGIIPLNFADIRRKKNKIKILASKKKT